MTKRVEGGRLNITLPKKLNRRFEAYLIEVVKRKGAIPYALKTKIARKAIEEWLNNHETDFDIDKLLPEE